MWKLVVCATGLLIQVESMLEVISRSRAFRIPVAVGGPAPTTSPDLFGEADVVFQGEAEGRIEDLLRPLSRRSGGSILVGAPEVYPEMSKVPVPRFDLLDISKYVSMSVQYSRGCPFQCEFCDIIVMFGRRPRVKSPAQVIAELEAIYRLGYRGTVFVVDDNFIGNKPAVRQLLPILGDWQDTRGRPFHLYTEASVDLAADPRLLRSMVDAGFSSVFLGIETPSVQALEQANKLQNLRLDPSEGIDRITRAGLEVMGGFIVGFDSDGPDIFALQREFLDGQPIPLAMVGILSAVPGTALWRRLEAEGRLRQGLNGEQFTRPNFVPVMKERDLLRGYRDLMKCLYSPKAFYKRCHAYIDRAGPVNGAPPATLGDLGVLLRAIWHIGVLSPRRGLFWKLMARVISRGRSHFRQAIGHAVQGEHLIRYTREYLVPRMEKALADVRIGKAPRLSPFPSDRGSTGTATDPAKPSDAGPVRFPAPRQAYAPSQTVFSRSEDDPSRVGTAPAPHVGRAE
ncbi:MAG: B12-binding domain-containing radical SAM protein [Planctomycetota bacterium]|jgi:radical SAM superfamily enzyme YgiQ (UPF0313 family)